jgi:hypothetical protein
VPEGSLAHLDSGVSQVTVYFLSELRIPIMEHRLDGQLVLFGVPQIHLGLFPDPGLVRIGRRLRDVGPPRLDVQENQNK